MRPRITTYKAVFGGLTLTALLAGSWSAADLAGGGAAAPPAAFQASLLARDAQQARWQLDQAQARANQARARAAQAAQQAQLQQASIRQASPTPAPTPTPVPAATTQPAAPPPPPPQSSPPPSSPPPPSGSGILTPAQVGAYWLSAGGPAWAEQAAEAVAMCESGDNTAAYNPSGASGLWQILGQVVPGNIFDPAVNAANAVAKFTQAGDNWSAWVCQP
jgi:multidrug efflux pump subunit AcrA (membrane-fusion protein)